MCSRTAEALVVSGRVAFHVFSAQSLRLVCTTKGVSFVISQDSFVHHFFVRSPLSQNSERLWMIPLGPSVATPEADPPLGRHPLDHIVDVYRIPQRVPRDVQNLKPQNDGCNLSVALPPTAFGSPKLPAQDPSSTCREHQHRTGWGGEETGFPSPITDADTAEAATVVAGLWADAIGGDWDMGGGGADASGGGSGGGGGRGGGGMGSDRGYAGGGGGLRVRREWCCGTGGHDA